MFRNVVAALNEAQDITLYLKPLKQPFKVDYNFFENIHVNTRNLSYLCDLMCHTLLKTINFSTTDYLLC